MFKRLLPIKGQKISNDVFYFLDLLWILWCLQNHGRNRVQKSDAGVGIGMLIGDRDYLGQKKEIGKRSFPVFAGNEIHLQASVDFISEKLMSGHSSSSTFHDFQISSFLIIKKSGTLNSENSKNRHLRFPKFS